MKYQQEIQLMTNTIYEAWDTFKNEKVDVFDKGSFDCVTNIDKGMEKFISSRILSMFPNDKIVGEEFSAQYTIPEGRAWVIDPIDGTVNMSHNLWLYGIQIGLFDGGEFVAATIYLPYFNETYTAVKGEGAYLNGKRTYVNIRPLNTCMVSIGDCAHKPQPIQDIKNRAYAKLVGKIGKFRNLGAASVDFSCVASGRTDGYLLLTKNLWDIYPGMLIATEAGGIAVSPYGEPYDYYRDEGICVMANQQLVDLLK